MVILAPKTPTADDVDVRLKEKARLKGIGRVLRGLGLMKLEDTEDIGLANLKTRMSQFPQQVLTGLKGLGRTADTETFLKSLKPDLTPEHLDTILGPPPVSPSFPPPPPPPPPILPPISQSKFGAVSGKVTASTPVKEPVTGMLGPQTHNVANEKKIAEGLGIPYSPLPEGSPEPRTGAGFILDILSGRKTTENPQGLDFVSYARQTPAANAAITGIPAAVTLGVAGYEGLKAATGLLLNASIVRQANLYNEAAGAQKSKEEIQVFAQDLTSALSRRFSMAENWKNIFDFASGKFTPKPEASQMAEDIAAQAVSRYAPTLLIPRGTQTGAMAMGGNPNLSPTAETLAQKAAQGIQWNAVERQFYANNVQEVEAALKARQVEQGAGQPGAGTVQTGLPGMGVESAQSRVAKYPATPAGAEARARAEGIPVSEASRLNAEEALATTKPVVSEPAATQGAAKEPWQMLSTNEQAERFGLDAKVRQHPEYSKLKQLVDSRYSRGIGEKRAYVTDGRDYAYLYADPGMTRSPAIAALQDKIAKDVGIGLRRDIGKFKGVTLDIPEVKPIFQQLAAQQGKVTGETGQREYVTLYHGTHSETVPKIKEVGFIPSEEGTAGRGVYLGMSAEDVLYERVPSLSASVKKVGRQPDTVLPVQVSGRLFDTGDYGRIGGPSVYNKPHWWAAQQLEPNMTVKNTMDNAAQILKEHGYVGVKWRFPDGREAVIVFDPKDVKVDKSVVAQQGKAGQAAPVQPTTPEAGLAPSPASTGGPAEDVVGLPPTASSAGLSLPPGEPPPVENVPSQSPLPAPKRPFRGVVISSSDELIKRVESQRIQGIAGKAVNLPVIKQAAKLINPIAVTDDPGTVLSAIGGMIDDQITGGGKILLAEATRLFPLVRHLFNPDSKGIVQVKEIKQIKPLPNNQQSMALHDIIEFAPWYDMGSGKQGDQRRAVIQSFRDASEQMGNMLRNENILVDGSPKPGQITALKGETGWAFLHRVVTQIKEEAADKVANNLTRVLAQEGISFSKTAGESSYQYVSRFADGVKNGAVKTTPEMDNLLDEFANLADVKVKKTTIAAKRSWDTVAEGLKSGVTYETNPLTELRKQTAASYELVRKKRLGEAVLELLETTTPTEKAAAELGVDPVGLSEAKTNSGKLVGYIQRVLRGESLPGGAIKVIREKYPDIGAKLDDVLKIPPMQRAKLINQALRDSIKAVRLTQKDAADLAQTIADMNLTFQKLRVKPDVTRTDIAEVINQTVRDKAAAAKAVKIFYSDWTLIQKTVLKDILGEAKSINVKDTESWRQLQALVSKYTERMGEFGTVEYGRVPGIPGLGNRVIPSQLGRTGQELADEIRRHFGYMPKSGADLAVEAVGKVGAVARMGKLGFDMSNALIQQALSLGYDIRNFVILRPSAVWLKATIGSAKAGLSRDMSHLEKFLEQNNDIVVDFVQRGGLIETAETVEGVLPLQQLTEKIKNGNVKSITQSISRHTLGRSDAVFTTGRVEAAVNMYKAGYKAAERAGQLDEWARLVNEMTGVLSTRAMGVGAGQRNIESAFVLMSPRFTRATGGIIADMISHPTGYTAKEAGTALLALFLAGAAIYLAIQSAQKKKATLNVFDPDFGNAELGERTYRLGGIISDLRRLMAVIDSTAYAVSGKRISLSGKEDKTLTLDKLGFQQFKSKTTPVTGSSIDIIRMMTDKSARDFNGNPLTWNGILGDWISPSWMDALLNEEMEAGAGATAEFFGLISNVPRVNEAKAVIGTLSQNLGELDKKGLEVALKEAEKDKASLAKIKQIKDKPRIYDIQSLRRDIAEEIQFLDDEDRAKLSPLTRNYDEYSKQKDAYGDLSDKEREAYLKANFDFVVSRLFWGEATALPDLKTAEAVESQAKQFNIALNLIPAFQLTDKGKERIPSDRTLWKSYFDYYALPGTSYLGMSKKQVDAGELPDKYRKDWETYQKLTTIRARNAFRKTHKEAAKSDWRQNFRRANPEFDKWLIDQEKNKPLRRRRVVRRSGGTAVSTPIGVGDGGLTLSAGGRGARRGTSARYPRARRPRIGTGVSVSAPRVRV